jgi:hypothetical protein
MGHIPWGLFFGAHMPEAMYRHKRRKYLVEIEIGIVYNGAKRQTVPSSVFRWP